MKRFMYILVVVSILVCLCSCGNNTKDVESPALFYYKRSAVSFFSEESVIDAEVRETINYGDDMFSLLNAYLAGPESEQFSSTFPANTSVKEISHNENAYTIKLSEHFSELCGLDLSIAVSCITRTVSNITQCDQVEIQIENPGANAFTKYVMSTEDICTFDSVMLKDYIDS